MIRQGARSTKRDRSHSCSTGETHESESSPAAPSNSRFSTPTGRFRKSIAHNSVSSSDRFTPFESPTVNRVKRASRKSVVDPPKTPSFLRNNERHDTADVALSINQEHHHTAPSATDVEAQTTRESGQESHGLRSPSVSNESTHRSTDLNFVTLSQDLSSLNLSNTPEHKDGRIFSLECPAESRSNTSDRDESIKYLYHRYLVDEERVRFVLQDYDSPTNTDRDDGDTEYSVSGEASDDDQGDSEHCGSSETYEDEQEAGRSKERAEETLEESEEQGEVDEEDIESNNSISNQSGRRYSNDQSHSDYAPFSNAATGTFTLTSNDVAELRRKAFFAIDGTKLANLGQFKKILKAQTNRKLFKAVFQLFETALHHGMEELNSHTNPNYEDIMRELNCGLQLAGQEPLISTAGMTRMEFLHAASLLVDHNQPRRLRRICGHLFCSLKNSRCAEAFLLLDLNMDEEDFIAMETEALDILFH